MYTWPVLVERYPQLSAVENEVLNLPPITTAAQWQDFMAMIRRRSCFVCRESLGSHRADTPAGIAISHLARVADDHLCTGTYRNDELLTDEERATKYDRIWERIERECGPNDPIPDHLTDEVDPW